MFGYSTESPLGHQGKASSRWSSRKYQPVPRSQQEEMIKEFREKQLAAKK